MENGVERRAARRFSMMLPLRVRFSAGDGIAEKPGETRDVSFRGLYFLIEANLESGTSIEFVLTLPQQITLAGAGFAKGGWLRRFLPAAAAIV